MKRIDATIYFGLEGAQSCTTIWVKDDATAEEIEEKLKEEALNKIEIDWSIVEYD